MAKKNQKPKRKLLRALLKIIGIFFGVMLVLIIGAGIAFMIIVDKPFVEKHLSEALYRQVSIGDVDVSVFSVLSGVEIRNIAVSNFKTPKQLETLKGKPIPANDVFVSLKSFNFKLAFGPLLKKQFVLKECVLYSPSANIVRYKNGLFNFSDLLAAKAPKQQVETEKEVPSKPLSADDIPVRISVGKVGIEYGSVRFTDIGSGQQIMVYDLNAKVFDIDIDPKNLNDRDIVKIGASFGIKTIGKTTTGSVKSFDIVLNAKGYTVPFDKKTRLLDPEVSLEIGSKRGMITGLQIFDKLKSVSALEKYCGKFDFLKDDLKWQDADTQVWYKHNVAKLKNTHIKTDDLTITFEGTVNTASTALNATADMTLNEKHTAQIRSGVKKNADKLITGKMKKVISADKVTDVAMKPLLGPGGGVYIKCSIKGTMSSPDTDMLAPKIPSLKDIVKESGGDLVDEAKDKAKEKAKEKIDEKKGKVAEKTKSTTKKKLKSLIK
jgi:hypothetical protein